ncbi:MAG: PepSY-associated TM helix domain-containing protein [Cyclobacteriaceae bacterium]
MFHKIRQLHLFSAFVLASFILMYFITGLVMTLEETFKRNETSSTTFVKFIPGIQQAGNDELLTLLKTSLDVHGQYGIQNPSPNQTVITFRHPGTETIVVIENGSDSVQTTVRKKDFVTVMHQFHRLHGYRGGFQYHLWAFMFDIASLSMIAFAFTGVYLWYKVEKRKMAGWVVLTVFTAFTGFTIFYLMHLT